jgi:ATP-dependent Clp protease ATP-binding subunit ClpA
MFTTVKKHLNDARAIASLCEAAESAAREAGTSKPGSEHFVLGALALSDQTAAATLTRLGITREAFEKAVISQFSSALQSVGVAVSGSDGLADQPSAPSRPKTALYEAEPSGQSLVQRLAATRKQRSTRALLSADVLLAVADEEFTVAARAFRALGVLPEHLQGVANQCIAEVERRSDA